MPKLVKRALLLLAAIAMLPASLYGRTGGTGHSGSDPASAQSGELPKGRSKMPIAKRAFLLLAVIAMLPASLYGCTGGTESNGNSVTVGIAQDLSNLDPQRNATAGIREVLFNIFEGLVKASPDGSVTEAVASDYEISADGKTYTFTLREGVTFHNGNRSQPRMWSIPWNAAPDRRTMERLWSRRFLLFRASPPRMKTTWWSPCPSPTWNSSIP